MPNEIAAKRQMFRQKKNPMDLNPAEQLYIHIYFQYNTENGTFLIANKVWRLLFFNKIKVFYST